MTTPYPFIISTRHIRSTLYNDYYDFDIEECNGNTITILTVHMVCAVLNQHWLSCDHSISQITIGHNMMGYYCKAFDYHCSINIITKIFMTLDKLHLLFDLPLDIINYIKHMDIYA